MNKQLFPSTAIVTIVFALVARSGVAAPPTVGIPLGDDGLTLEMVRTPAGLWFGKFEVTQAQWRRVVGSRISGGREVDEGADKPVVGASPKEIEGFFQKLNAMDGPRNSGLSFRLPTAEEWTDACLAGGNGKWPLGADGREGSLDGMGWYCTRQRDGGHAADPVQPVGRKAPNAFGLYDMLGNAEEMTSTTILVDKPFLGQVPCNVWCGGGVNFRPQPEPILDAFVGQVDDGGQNFRDGARARRTEDGPLNQGGFRVCATGEAKGGAKTPKTAQSPEPPRTERPKPAKTEQPQSARPVKSGASSHAFLNISSSGVTTSSSASVTGGGRVSSTQTSVVDGIRTTIKTVTTAAGTETEIEYSADTPEAQRRLANKLHDGVDGFPKDINLAIHWYEKAVDGGDAVAMNNLGVILENDEGNPENVKRGHALIARAAELAPRDEKVIYNLGCDYYFGTGVPRDYAKAAEWFKRSADMGFSEAQYKLGRLYYDGGERGPVQFDRALHWFKAAAEQGLASAQNMVGLMYAEGKGVAQDYGEAMSWYMKAAEQNFAMAQRNIGYNYDQGNGVALDYAEAAKWYRKAAENGNDYAQNRLGVMLYDGIGVERDYAEALKWFRKAAEQGVVSAMGNLGNAYKNGKGVEQDYAEAARWYLMAAERGYGSAQDGLGELYYNGKGVEQNYAEAAKWFRKAAEQGNSDAQDWLGICYQNGRGVEQDNEIAASWFRKAAEQGFVGSMLRLGNCYRNGKGVEQNYAKAVAWYRKGADAGNLTCMNSLGLMYNLGQGVEQDNEFAAQWFRKAAEGGHMWGQYNLGVFYRDGKGVEKNPKKALMWFRKAAEQGCDDAKTEIEKLEGSDGAGSAASSDWDDFETNPLDAIQ